MNKFKAWILAGALGLLAPSWAIAQQGAPPVTTFPSGANSGNACSGAGCTVASSSLFQQIWAATDSTRKRTGCLVMNVSTHGQYVYFQGPGMVTPTAGNYAIVQALSVPLNPVASPAVAGGWVQCANGAGATLQDSVWIGGTAGDAYYANQQ